LIAAQPRRWAGELPGANPLELDITVEHAVQDAFARLERLDILVNCAGIGLVGTAEERNWRISTAYIASTSPACFW